MLNYRGEIHLNIHVMAKDTLEAQGVRWMIESHLPGIQLMVWDSMEEFSEAVQNERPDLVILDMDSWTKNSEGFCELLQRYRIRWLGLSSERIFQTAYRALRLTRGEVFKSLFKKKAYAIWDWQDPKPGMIYFKKTAGKMLKRK